MWAFTVKVFQLFHMLVTFQTKPNLSLKRKRENLAMLQKK